MTTHRELTAAAYAAAHKLASLQFTRIVGEADEQDAKNLTDDVLAVARICDELMLAVGRYAQSTLGIGEQEVKQYFTDQMLGAVEGNATHILESIGHELAEQRREYDADPKGWARANMMGVD